MTESTEVIALTIEEVHEMLKELPDGYMLYKDDKCFYIRKEEVSDEEVDEDD